MWRMRSAARSGFVAFIVLISTIFACQYAQAQSALYSISKDYTNVRFSWSNLGLSRQSARVMSIDGTAEFDPLAPETSRVDVMMNAASLWTGIPSFDELLKSADFFDVRRHPTIRFRSTSVRRMSDRTGELVGDLTIMGITNPVTLYVVWNYTGEHPLAAVNPNYKSVFVSGFSATGVLRRSDWGLSRGVPLVSDEIEVTIETELIRQ
jgi:polyisoprenoid-binding protein YceI